ncbi:DNA cytosine methyltransferase [Streptomyces beihaiensis]|uniref:DNA cytosine methyltransferase n=1 Tax=Streptomyces beihaiensis TaxID=2984495 RepID=UPI002B1CD452|nr:DNA cytosine methyltransferase [Streptomyces beihaiensis]
MCSGAGGLALGMEQAGLSPRLLLDNDPVACEILRLNRPDWPIDMADLRDFDPAENSEVYDVDVLLAGVPRFRSAATVQRSSDDEAVEMFRAAMYLAPAVRPRALVIENVPAMVESEELASVRELAHAELEHLGYRLYWDVLNAMDFAVPQDRRVGLLVALREESADRFRMPEATVREPLTVGEALLESMASRGWPGARRWAAHADTVAPTLVGGSTNRGGADFGPRGSQRRWQRMGVYTKSYGDVPPGPDFVWDPDLGPAGLVPVTVEQAALVQGFPAEWRFTGGKTKRYGLIAQACPPPLAGALGRAIESALRRTPRPSAG